MIGQRIRYYRKTKGLTQDELAKGICSVSYLSKIENGDAKSSEDVIELLCERLGISPEEKQLDVNIVGMLNEWNYFMALRKFSEADELHHKIIKYIDLIEDPTILIRYKLFLARDYLTKNKIDDAKSIINEINKIKEIEFDPSLNFYFSFINGLYNYIVFNYQESLNYFTKAETYINQTPLNQVEIATFFYSIALTQTHLFHNTSVINYAYKALNIFDKEYNFTRSADCQILLGIVNRRIKNYTQSEHHFSQALKFAESFNDNKSLGIIYHNLGFVFSSKGENEKAIDYYLKSISIKEKGKNPTIYMTYFLIAKEYFNLGNNDDAKEWLKKVYDTLQVNPDQEYYIHYRTLKFQLNNPNDKKFEQFIKKEAMPFFQEKNIMEHYSEYATILADYYFKNSQYKNASEYYKLALKAGHKFY